MGKRRTRITPKILRKPRRVTKSPESSKESQQETSSTEDNTTTRRRRANSRGGRTASKRNVSSVEKNISSSRNSSISSVDNESQGESTRILKKRRRVEENREQRTKRKTTMVNKQEENVTKNENQEKSGRARGTSRTTPKSSNKETKTSERIRDLIVTQKVFSKWKPISLSTKDYIKQVIADTSPNIVGNISSDRNKDQVQHCLQNLQKRILVKMEKIRGPRHQLDYREIEPESKKVEESLTSARSQLSLIEAELVEQKRLLEIEEESLKKLTSQPTKKLQNTKQLHPLLQKTFTTTLNLPILNKEALDLPIPKITTELNKGAQKLSTTLADLSNEVHNLGVTSWLESVSQLHTSLNQSS